MKAVIMAGGEGERMRPLTCTVPKPMLRLCGRPVLRYTLELLKNNGCTHAVLSIRYLSDEIKEFLREEFGAGSGAGQDEVFHFGQMKISYVEEKEKLGTAGGVKLAAQEFLNDTSGAEPFLVISGDAICDFNLSHFESLHNGSNNELSILLTKVSDPREYGLVTLTKLGKISSFIEKPSWSRSVSDLANTGIYFINPQVLSYIPDGVPYDFSKDLFPKMMKSEKIIGGFEEQGYWCDIGDIRSYVRCQSHIMSKRVKTSVNISENYVCSNDGRIPGGRYKIIPPVFIGGNVRIGDGTIVGPGTVIDDGCVIGSNAHIKNSIVLQNARVENNARMTGTVLAENTIVKNSAELYDSSVLGSSSVLGERSSILQNVLVWPDKLIPPHVRVFENVVNQPPQRDFFDDEGVSGSADSELNPAQCAKLGHACASLRPGTKIGIATDGSRTARALKMAMQSGAMASGGYVWDFGEAFMSQMPFFAAFCGLDIGIFIKNPGMGTGNDVTLTFCGSDGLPLARSVERDIEKRLRSSNFIRTDINRGRDISSITSIRLIYSQELCRVARGELNGIAVAVESENPEIARVFRECLDRVGAAFSDELSIRINEDGTDVVMHEKTYPKVSHDTLVAICCNNEFRAEKDVALPASAPHIIDDMADMYSRRVLRYSESSMDNSDENARRLASCQAWSKDALFTAMKVLRIMHDRKLSLHELVEEIPKFYRYDRNIVINFSPVKLKEILKGDDIWANVAFAEEGLTVTNELKGVKAVVMPSKKGNRLRILAEAESMNAAEEFALDISQRISSEINKP